MALIAKEGSSFEPAPEGVFPARCVWVIDIGTQISDGLYGHKENHQTYINWELVDESTSGGQPLTIGAFFTVSLSKKATLRATLESWRGRAFSAEELKGFDISKLINAPCLISVKHQPKADGSGIRAQVSAVMAPMKGQSIGSAREPTILLDLDAPDAKEKVATLPEWLQNKIAGTPEWVALRGVEPTPPATPLNNVYSAMKAGQAPPASPAAPPSPAPAPAGGGFDDDIPFSQVADFQQ